MLLIIVTAETSDEDVPGLGGGECNTKKASN